MKQLISSKTLDEIFTHVEEKYFPFVLKLKEEKAKKSKKINVYEIAYFCYITNMMEPGMEFQAKDLLPAYRMIKSYDPELEKFTKDEIDMMGGDPARADEELKMTTKAAPLCTMLKNVGLIEIDRDTTRTIKSIVYKLKDVEQPEQSEKPEQE